MFKTYDIVKYSAILLVALCSAGCSETEQKEDTLIKLNHNTEEQYVEVRIGQELFTRYLYSSEFKKPVLYPILTHNGNPVTRGYPIDPRPGERADHPHHVGLWLNYGDVNGLDFWNNSDQIPPSEKEQYGRVVHRSVDKIESGDNQGRLEVTAEWVNAAEGTPLLKEETTFIFRSSANKRIVDRITTLQALGDTVSLHDNKEGMLGLRVARELEHPSDEPALLIDASGQSSGRRRSIMKA
ncbi:MAG: PmoA family protein [Balneolaceae bacterium]|nr:PmoA family protein [Balneolaceae bacterium]